MYGAADASGEARDDAWFDLTEQRARPRWFTAVTYWAIHVACLGALWTGVTRADLALLAGTYLVRVFGVMGGYHRYFSHRAFKTSRAMQLVLALLGCLGAHRGALWWASHHRRHHRYSDTRRDIISPLQRSLYYAHTGWALDVNNAATDLERIADFAVFPELRWLDRWSLVPWVASSALIAYVFGWSGFVWGVCFSTVLNWHAVHCVGSVSHQLGGYRRYPTTDNSRNKWFFAMILLGEWHNNHHYYPTSARLGFVPWELDPIYWVLCALRRLGLIWDVRVVPPHLVHLPDAATRAGVGRLGSWLLGLREAISRRLEEAARHPEGVDAGALALVKHGLDARLDAFETSALDLSVRDPEQLGQVFAALREGLRDDVGAGALPDALVARLGQGVAETLAEHAKTCPFGHFLDRQRTET